MAAVVLAAVVGWEGAVVGEALRSRGLSDVANGSTRHPPSNVPSARNSSQPCAADGAGADSEAAGGAEQATLRPASTALVMGNSHGPHESGE